MQILTIVSVYISNFFPTKNIFGLLEDGVLSSDVVFIQANICLHWQFLWYDFQAFLWKHSFIKFALKCGALPWLVWLSGLSASLQTKGSPVRFPIKAHAWVSGQFPVGGMQEVTTYRCFSPTQSPSLPLSLKINRWKIKHKNKNERIKCGARAYDCAPTGIGQQGCKIRIIVFPFVPVSTLSMLLPFPRLYGYFGAST